MVANFPGRTLVYSTNLELQLDTKSVGQFWNNFSIWQLFWGPITYIQSVSERRSQFHERWVNAKFVREQERERK